VKTQIWIAVSVYVLVAIVKKRLNIFSVLSTINVARNEADFSNQLNLLI